MSLEDTQRAVEDCAARVHAQQALIAALRRDGREREAREADAELDRLEDTLLLLDDDRRIAETAAARSERRASPHPAAPER